MVCFNVDKKASNSKTMSITVKDTTPPPTNPTPNPGTAPDQPVANPGNPNGSTNGSTNDKSITADGKKVEIVGNNDKVSGLVVIDPSNVLDTDKQKQITKVEYYLDGKLVQTVTKAPFALDTTLLDNGSYTMTEKTYFADGSIQEQSGPLEVANKLTVFTPMVKWARLNKRPLAVGGVSIGSAAIASAGFFVARHFYLQRRLMHFHGF
jgi:hypothetical protein